PNGVGKTTLIKLMLGEIQPDSGDIRMGTNLQLAYFDQHRSQFDDELNLRENIAPGNDYVEINGEKKHIISYLQDFLFTPQQIQKPVKVLSGGERNRLLLARLFARPSNLLVLDEPTNDLDAETLELLEELLVDYQGTLLLISHDRSFLNAVVTRSIVFENGGLCEYAGGYDDWLLQRPPPESLPRNPEKTSTRPADTSSKADTTTTAARPATRPAKLSYKDRRELEQLPQHIEQLEARLAEVQTTLSDPAFYQQAPTDITRVQAQLQQLEQTLEQAFERWAQLEAQQQE
ncbi:MAG TPA: ATP-binding cassette domain-containing protein, partial [Thiolinea sp.]|nr:ATP-binding cassette domain-containing protein [Thiolinea sp.]